MASAKNKSSQTILSNRVILLLGVIMVVALASAIIIFNKVRGASTQWGLAVGISVLLYLVVLYVYSAISEGRRRAKDRMASVCVYALFLVAIIPLISLLYTVVSRSLNRLDLEFFSSSMQGILGDGGGAFHAIIGTLEITAGAIVISVPIGLFAAIYIVEYGRKNKLSHAIRFFVDVMTGIPSIVAGLFAYSLFLIILGPGKTNGFAGSIALSILMIPVVIRSCEEVLALVPDDLREASYALGVQKWLTICKVVLPTALSGIVTGIMLAVARVIGETAPLLLVAGVTQSVNRNLFDGPMLTLPVFVYKSYASQGTNANAFVDRAWTGAFALIVIVILLNLVARLIARRYGVRTVK